MYNPGAPNMPGTQFGIDPANAKDLTVITLPEKPPGFGGNNSSGNQDWAGRVKEFTEGFSLGWGIYERSKKFFDDVYKKYVGDDDGYKFESEPIISPEISSVTTSDSSYQIHFNYDDSTRTKYYSLDRVEPFRRANGFSLDSINLFTK